MKPSFDKDFEYDEWFDKVNSERILDEYFGKEVEDGKKRGFNK